MTLTVVSIEGVRTIKSPEVSVFSPKTATTAAILSRAHRDPILLLQAWSTTRDNDMDIDIVILRMVTRAFGHRLISGLSRLVTSGVEPSSLHRRLYNCGHLLSLTGGQLSTIGI